MTSSLRPLGRPIPHVYTQGIGHTWCDPYGAETGGAKRFLGQTGHTVHQQWHCDNHATVRARMSCEHGHVGLMMNLCRPHYNHFRNRGVQFCPACNVNNDHRCRVEISEIS
jgi:hypothetical protein